MIAVLAVFVFVFFAVGFFVEEDNLSEFVEYGSMSFVVLSYSLQQLTSMSLRKIEGYYKSSL